MDGYRYIYLILFVTSAVVSETVESKLDGFDVFGVVYDIVGGISNLARLINGFKDVFGVLAVSNVSVRNNTPLPVPEDTFLNITELASKYEYPIEDHKVSTEDGYILMLHRIPKGRNSTSNNLVVFLMHGILDCSDSWILQGPNKSLAYILADAGFDVWMGNARGNKHSLSHKTLNTTQSEFWAFTWEEIGTHDLPALIDYVLEQTKKETLYYVGHSQGTTSFYAMSSLRPEYNGKIKMMFSLAPVAWMGHVKSPIVKMFSPANKILQYINSNAYSHSTEYFSAVTSIICNFLPIRCDSLLNLIIGYDFKHINTSMLPVILGHMPAGSSTLQFVHYGQLVQSGRFCRYDRGETNNLKAYGARAPPDYELSNVTAPVVLYYSGNDWLSDPADVATLRDRLNVHEYYYLEDFNHMDYLYADIANDLIYSSIIRKIFNYETDRSAARIKKDNVENENEK